MTAAFGDIDGSISQADAVRKRLSRHLAFVKFIYASTEHFYNIYTDPKSCREHRILNITFLNMASKLPIMSPQV